MTHPDVITVATGHPALPDPEPETPGPVNMHPGPDLPWDCSPQTAARLLAALRALPAAKDSSEGEAA